MQILVPFTSVLSGKLHLFQDAYASSKMHMDYQSDIGTVALKLFVGQAEESNKP